MYTKKEIEKIFKSYKFPNDLDLSGVRPGRRTENKKAYLTFDKEYPGLCRNVSEFIYILRNRKNKTCITSQFCPVCGNRVNFSCGKYYTYCSSLCGRIDKMEDILKKREKTWKKKYGVTSPFQLEEVKKTSQSKKTWAKRKKTCLIRYGVDNPTKNKDIAAKISQTLQSKTEKEWKSIIRKRQKTIKINKKSST